MDKIVSLNTNAQFRRAYNKGMNAVDSTMVLYVIRNGRRVNRLGITVTKKLGGAVQRNRAKRRLKEVYRLNAQMLKFGYDIVIVARGRTNEASFDVLQKAFARLAARVKLLK